MKSFEGALADAQSALQAHPWGHLPLSRRVDLMRILGDPATVNRIYLECAQQVYPIWIADNKFDTSIRNLLEAARAHLTGTALDVAGLKKLADHCRVTTEATSHTSGMAGMSAIYASDSIANQAAGVLRGDDGVAIDDGQLDWDVWSADFCASIAAAGGNPFVGAGDPERRRAFWQWYLTMVNRVQAGARLVEVELPSADLHSSAASRPRSQTWERPDLADLVRRVIELCLRDLASANLSSWDRVTLTGDCMKAGLAMKGRYMLGAAEQSFRLTYYLYKGDDSAVQLMNRVKSEMYHQAPDEGGWMQFTLVVEADSQPAITFNYDDVDTLPPSWRDPSSLAEEFRAFPRAKTFTPPWWHDVVNKSGLSYRPCQQKE